MRIILLENIKNLGKKDEVKEVAEGYAINFLFPKRLAAIATPEEIDKLKERQKKIEKERKIEEEKLKKIANEIRNKKITITAKTEKEKLFGSIGKKEICKELKNLNFNISEQSILLEDPIKTTGEKEITIDFGKNIKTKIIVAIEKA